MYMKRLSLLISFVAALALAAGCNKSEPSKLDEGISATFNVTLPGEIATKAISDGTGANELLFQVFDAEGRHLQALDQTVAVSGKKATVTTNLVRGVSYNFVFWAQKRGQYSITEKNGRQVMEISANKLPSMMNSDAWDAFYATKSVAAQEADFSADVTLYRPFAQLNVGASAEDIAVAQANKVDLGSNLKTAFTIGGVKNVLDLVSGEVSGSEKVTYTAAVAPSDNISTKDGKTYRRIAMVYVLAAPQSATSAVTLNVQSKQNGSVDLAFAREVPNVPLRRNHRTNIVGEIFSLNGTFNVLVDERFDQPDTDLEIDVPAPAPTTYNVTIAQNIANGSVAVEGTSASFEEGETVTLTVAAEDNYELSYLAYTPAEGGSAVDINLKTLQFPMPAFDVIVTARFSQAQTPVEPEYTGDGTANNPYTIADIRKYIDAMEDPTTPSEEEVYVKGIVSKIANNGQFNTQFGNASFYMTDPEGGDDFEAYRINYFDNKPWQEGDRLIEVGQEAVVFGKVVLYKGSSSSTYETYQKKDVYNGYLVSLSGESETAATPAITAMDPTGAPTTVIPVGSNGLQVSITSTDANASIYYTLDGSIPSQNSTAYSQPFFVSEACTVKAIAYNGNAASAVASLTITKASVVPTEGGSGTADDPYTVAGVRAFIDGLGAAGTVSENAVYVKGVVKSVAGRPSATYSNASFYMTDPDGTDEFEAYRINFLGDAPWTVNDVMVAEGDEVVVYGKVKLYVSGSNQTYETNQVANGDHGYLVSLNGKSAALAAPEFTAPTTEIAPGANGVQVTITAAQGATIHYTTDGSNPTEDSQVYSQPLNITEACTIKAIATSANAVTSAIASLKITKSDGVTYRWVDTPLAQIAAGAELVIVSEKDGKYYAMTNNNAASAAPTAVAVTVSNNTISTPDDILVWTLAKPSATTYQFAAGSSYLYCTNTNNGVRVGSNENNVFHVDADSGYLVNDGHTRWVGVYNNADWRCYTTLHTNIAGQTFHYFVKTK